MTFKLKQTNTVHRAILCAIACAMAANVLAAEVALVGVFPGKAVLSVDGSAPRVLAPGQSLAGVKLISVERDAAVIELGGKRERIELGRQAFTISSGSAEESTAQSVTLIADARGHFVTSGSINGAPVTFLVDTGASAVAITTEQAKAAGINYLKGVTGYVNTANGTVQAWQVPLDKVTVNGLTLHNVEGIILPAGSGIALLGMSYLNRLSMSREGNTMILKRRY